MKLKTQLYTFLSTNKVNNVAVGMAQYGSTGLAGYLLGGDKALILAGFWFIMDMAVFLYMRKHGLIDMVVLEERGT